MTRLLACGALAAIVLLTVAASPALADPARPGNTEAVVLSVSPSIPGLIVEVTGGDSFLRLVAPANSTIEVPGYNQDEPYLRFDPDGAVYENRNSRAYWMNLDRYGLTDIPQTAMSGTAPDWHQVASGGEWAWHDHRIHWMSPDLPTNVTGEGPAMMQPWSVPFTVDGREVTASGDLTWYPSVSPVPWIAVVIIGGVVGWVMARRSVTATGVVVTVAAGLAVVSSMAQASVTPAGAGGELVSEGAAAAATLLGLTTLVAGRRIASISDLPALIAAVLLVIWTLQRIGALWLPILPTPLAPGLERLLVAAVFGAALACGAAILSRRLSPPQVGGAQPTSA